ncbi:MAG: MDR family MFS transporter, partial [Dehalococcoidia bacterium]
MSTPPLGHLPHRRKMVIMAAAMLAMFVSAVNQTLVTTAIPRIVADLEGFTYLSWIFTAYMLTATTSSPVWGKLSDRWGRKLFLIAGILIFIVTSSGAGLSQNIYQLIFWRGLQGFGGGMLMACGFTVIADLFTPRERGRYSGLLAGVFGVSSIIGPLLGGFLTDTLSWRWTFYANIPVALIALPILARALPTVRQPARGRVDLMGASTLTVAVVPLLLAFVWAGSEYPWGSVQIVGLTAFSVAMTGAFIAVEFRAADPILPMHLFRNHTYTMTSVITVLQGFGMFGAITFVPFLAQGVIGLSATGSGTVTSPMMVSMVIASTMSGTIYSRGGAFKPLVVSGMLIIVSGLGALSMLGADTSQFTVIAFMLVMGFGMGFALPVLSVMVQNAVPAQYLGVVTSNTQFYRSIGGTISVAIMGTVVTTRLNAGLPPPNPRLAALPDQLVERLRDPQALVSPEVNASLREAVSSLPGGEAVFISS